MAGPKAQPPAISDQQTGGFWTRPPYAVDSISAPKDYTTAPFLDDNNIEHKFARGIECTADTDVTVVPVGSTTPILLKCKEGVQKGFFFQEVTAISAGTIYVLF